VSVGGRKPTDAGGKVSNASGKKCKERTQQVKKKKEALRFKGQTEKGKRNIPPEERSQGDAQNGASEAPGKAMG